MTSFEIAPLQGDMPAQLAVWRTNEARSLTNNRFFVDYVSNKRWGIRVMVADKLTREQAENMVAQHNATVAEAQ